MTTLLLLAVATFSIVSAVALWRSPSQVDRLSAASQPTLRETPKIMRLPSRWVDLARRRRGSNDEVVQLLILLDADVRAGVTPESALANALQATPLVKCVNTRRALAGHSSVAVALQADAEGESEMSWALLALGWNLSAQYGVSLSSLVQRIVRISLHHRKAQQRLQTELAAPMAGAKLLAALPLLGIGLGLLLGANPIGWLFGSIFGWLVLAVALAFEAAGILWVRQIVRRASMPKSMQREIPQLAPLAAQLIAACVDAGTNILIAVEATGDALGEPIRTPLLKPVAQLRLGANTKDAWLGLKAWPELSLLANVIARASVSGASISRSLGVIAEAADAELIDQFESRAKVAGVKVVAPLALCFLPAFMLVTVVPVVGSLVPAVLSF